MRSDGFHSRGGTGEHKTQDQVRPRIVRHLCYYLARNDDEKTHWAVRARAGARAGARERRCWYELLLLITFASVSTNRKSNEVRMRMRMRMRVQRERLKSEGAESLGLSGR